MSIIKWLHLSDFHIGKDGYEQDKIFKNILKHIEDEVKEKTLNLIFITGDISNRNSEKEYYAFIENFLEKIPNKENIKIYIVPGNHDIDRIKVDRVGRASLDSKFFRANDEGLNERKKYEIPAFNNFSDFIELSSNLGNWLETKEGVFTDIIEINNIKIGIVGTNTAWFSRDDKDKEQLSFGIDLVETGLKKIEMCDIRIVLGHHPIDWFIPTKQERIKNLFKDYGVIYLHGHLHITKTTIGQYINSNFLNIQAGAAFQASENKSNDKKNSLLWSEIDFEKRSISLQPRYWDYNQRRWEFNQDYLESDRRRDGNQNWWEYELPVKKGEKKVTTNRSEIPVPKDWFTIDSDFFDERSRTSLTEDDYIKYFDGALPKWHSDFLKSIPKRNIVQQIYDDFRNNFANNKNLFYLLHGAGGEGKTTAFMQIVSKLNELNKCITLLQNNKNTIFPENYQFLSDKRYLLVFEDINQKTVKNIQNLLQKNTNISIFVCTRTSDWIASDGSKTPWSDNIEFKEYSLKGLEGDEAREIVEFWAKYGQKGLKKLYGKNIETITKELLKASKDNGNDTFFGAILEIRMAEQLKDHIKSILQKLKEIQIEKSEKTILDAFVPIVLMHSENLEFFSEIVLAKYIFNDSTKNIKSKIITPLGKEAAAVTAGNLLFTRHKKIADETKKILEEDYEIDSNEIFLELIKSATDILVEKENFVDEINSWRFDFSVHFIDTNKKLAIDIAKVSLDKEKKVQNLTHLSGLYRKINKLKLARDLFLNFDIDTEKSDIQRGFMYEWGVIEGLIGNHALNIWLAATSISDWNYQISPDKERCVKSLTGISQASEKLNNQYNEFTQVIEASAILALKIAPDDKNLHLQKYVSSTMSPDEASQLFIKYINNVWSYFDKNHELLKKIPNEKEMKFDRMLQSFIKEK